MDGWSDFVVRFPTQKDYIFFGDFLVDLMETQPKTLISLSGFLLCELTILAAPKQRVFVGCLLGTGMKLFNSIQSQRVHP